MPERIKVYQAQIVGEQHNGSETLHKLHGGVVGTWIVLTDKQVEALDEHHVYLPKADVLHMVVRADIFGKTVLCEFVPGVCPVRGGLSYFQRILLVMLCEHLAGGS